MHLLFNVSIYLRSTLFFLLISLFSLSLASEAVKPDQTLFIPMRDGVELPTDIYLPYPEAKNLPCILQRGPAGRHVPTATCFAALAKAGYVVAIQDTRAANDKEGKTLPFYSDGWGKEQDGYDTVQWLADHPLTNGKIGTLGFSNMGITQILMAPTAPPALKCQYIGVAAASLYHHAIFPGAQLLKNQVEGWLHLVAKDPSVLKFVLDQAHNEDFWDSFNAIKLAQKVTVPAIHQGGWYDIFIQGTIEAFQTRQDFGGEGAKGKQKLYIGPWAHMGPLMPQLGEFEIPKNGYVSPYDMTPLSWFNHHLKEHSYPIVYFPTVVYYVMGPFDGSPSSGNRWRTSEEWPIPHVDIPFYLTSDQKLVEKEIPLAPAIISYTHQIYQPVPTIGGRNLFLPSGPMDQRPIESRKDVKVFTTAPLTEDLEVTGNILAKIFLSTDAADTDLAVRLTDVYPDGRSILIADALTRTQFQKTVSGETSAIKGVLVDLWSTSLVFAKGHAIRISISGSNFPRFEKNTNSVIGKDKDEVTHHLHIGKIHASHLILPVVRKGNQWLTTQHLPPAFP